MTAEEPCQLTHLPLHILAIVLTELGSIKSLGSAILTHRTCLTAFNENRVSITVDIIRKQIPVDLLPFAFALHESRQIHPDDHDAICGLLTKLAQGIPDPAIALSSLVRQSMSEAATISDSYRTIELLCQHFTNFSIPLLNDRLGLNHPQQASKQERFRLGRAFYRYQLMCNLFCRANGEYCCGRFSLDEQQDKCSRLFFQSFSPWVNEQLVCVYAYLRGSLCKAIDETVAHDLFWAELCIPFVYDPQDDPNVQNFLAVGLSFMNAIIEAQGYDQWNSVLDWTISASLDEFRWLSEQLNCVRLEDDVLSILEPGATEAPPTNSHGDSKLALLKQRLDGDGDAPLSSPFNMWSIAHQKATIFNATYSQEDENLWECGYVIWDHHQQQELDRETLATKMEEARKLRPYFERNGWPYDEWDRSTAQRAYIWHLGGEGYWPRTGLDFSRISGLSEEHKEQFLCWWSNEEKRRNLKGLRSDRRIGPRS